jgi:hypothetical protein
MDKRGISDVVTTLIFILLAIVSIAIVWMVVVNVLDSSDDVSIDRLNAGVKIVPSMTNVDNENGEISFTIDGVTSPKADKIKVVLSNGSDLFIDYLEDTPETLGRIRYNDIVHDLEGELISLTVFPVYTSSKGEIEGIEDKQDLVGSVDNSGNGGDGGGSSGGDDDDDDGDVIVGCGDNNCDPDESWYFLNGGYCSNDCGSGTTTNPYQISNCVALQNVNTNINANYLLVQDIDCGGITSFTPLGLSYFNGVFDGDGKKISGITINKPLDNNVGFFKILGGSGVVKNLILNDINVLGNNSVGGIVGANNGKIDSSSVVRGEIKALGHGYSGGLVGSNRGVINNSYSDVSVRVVENSPTDGRYSGGIAGENVYSGGIIENSYSLGEVRGSIHLGGITGRNLGSSSQVRAKIINSYSRSRVYGLSSVGGLSGSVTNADIINSYSTGLVSATSSFNVGGLVGVSVNPAVTNSYWDTQTSSRTISDGGTGKTTAQMKTQSTYVGWNFDSVWEIDSSVNEGYPHLKLLE